MRIRSHQLFYGVTVILISLLTSCNISITPSSAVRGFVNALNDSDEARALDYVCGVIVVLPDMPIDFIQNIEVNEIKKAKNQAVVYLYAEIIVESSDGALKYTIDGNLPMERRNNGEWCISANKISLEEAADILNIAELIEQIGVWVGDMY